MIWATVSSRSWFCWLYRESFSIFGCKEYNQSDFGGDHLVMSMCRVFSCVAGRGWLLWPVCSLGKTLLAFALLHSVLQGQTCPLLQVFLYFCIPVPYNEKDVSFWVLVLGLVGLHRTVFNFSYFSITGRGIDLDYFDIEWLSLEMNSDHSVVFETASKRLDSLANYDGYSTSSKGFLPTVVDIMVSWVKFTNSSPF